MVVSIEQFTAPGKYYIDLALKNIDLNLEGHKDTFIGLLNYKKYLFKQNPYYIDCYNCYNYCQKV